MHDGLVGIVDPGTDRLRVMEIVELLELQRGGPNIEIDPDVQAVPKRQHGVGVAEWPHSFT